MSFYNIMPQLILKKREWVYLLTILIYRLLLDAIYIIYINPRYEYYHFTYNPDMLCIAASIVLLWVIVRNVPILIRRGSVSDIILVFLILMYYVPYTSLFALSYHSIPYTFFVVTYFVFLVIFDLSVSLRKFKFRILHKGFGDTKLFVVMVIILGFLMIVISGVYTGFRISFNLSEYYEYRAAARENSLPEIVRYLFNWSSLGLTIGLAYSLTKNRIALSVFIVICKVLAFSYNGKKSVLFMLFLTIAISLFYRQVYLKLVPIALPFMCLASLTEMVLRSGKSFIAQHFIRRMIYVPPMMGTLYYDYFSKHELDFLRSSVLRRLGFVSPYVHIPRFIGRIYFNNDLLAMNANTGLCGDAYANFGQISLLFVPFIIVLTFKIIEKCTSNNDYRINMVVAFSIAYSFVSGAYFTLLLTNGVIFICFLLAFLNPSKEYDEISEN